MSVGASLHFVLFCYCDAYPINVNVPKRMYLSCNSEPCRSGRDQKAFRKNWQRINGIYGLIVRTIVNFTEIIVS